MTVLLPVVVLEVTVTALLGHPGKAVSVIVYASAALFLITAVEREPGACGGGLSTGRRGRVGE